MEEKDRHGSCTGAACLKTELACLPCFIRQVVRTLGYAGVNRETGRDLLRRAESIIEQASLDQPPARISTLLHRLIREETGLDPYRAVKDTYNQKALDLLPMIRRMAESSSGANPLAGGVRAAIAGNIIDFGIFDSVDLDLSLRESFDLPLSDAAFDEFSRSVVPARRILYLCDNAGEIVFDRVLIDILTSMGKDVTAVVKGVPVINDATLEDAAAVDLSASGCQVMDNGNDGIGTLLERCSARFSDAYGSADLIISKGQANFETLATVPDDRIYFLFKVKCRVVAQWLRRENGELVLMRNQTVGACPELVS